MADAITVSGAHLGHRQDPRRSPPECSPPSPRAPSSPASATPRPSSPPTATTSTREGIDFFPLTVDVEEKAYAVGKIPGSFFRREGRPSDEAVLTCRLIDRPLRPSFAEGYRNETQVVATIIGADQVNPHDVIAINGASAALMLSGLPFDGPLGAVRLAYSTDGEWVPHPTFDELDDSTFQLVVAGRSVGDGDVAIMMVEGNGTEKAWSLLRGRRPQGHRGGHRRRPREVQGLDRRVDRAPAPSWSPRPGVRPALKWESQLDYDDDVLAAVDACRDDVAHRPTPINDKTERNDATTALRDRILAELTADGKPFAGRDKQVKNAIRSAHQEGHPRAPGRTRASAWTAVVPATSVPCRPRSASSPPPTAPACSSGVRPRSSTC